MPVTKKKLLLPREQYLSAGVHIGMTSKTADMKRFIYKVRPNGLAVLNVGILDRRISYVSSLLAGKNSILIVSGVAQYLSDRTLLELLQIYPRVLVAPLR